MLKLLGVGNFIDRLQLETSIEFNDGIKQTLDRYIRQYPDRRRDMTHILKLDQDELETDDIEVLNITIELIYGAFGIKVITIKNKKWNGSQNGSQQLPINFAEVEPQFVTQIEKSIWMKRGELIIPKGL